MPSNQKCSQCLHLFSLAKLPRKLPNCPHSICQPCLRDIIDKKQDVIICAFCSNMLKKHQIRVFSLNTSILLSLPEVPPAQPTTHVEEQNQLLGDIIQQKPTPAETTAVQQLCPTHKVVMDIICISDKHRICPHCALFGNHKDHRFKRLDDFHKQIGEKRKVFNEIQFEKANLFKGQSFKIFQQMNNLMKRKKYQLIQQIQSQWKRYYDLLKAAKQKALKQVDQCMCEIQQSIKDSNPYNKFQKSKVRFQNWENTCLEAIEYIDSSLNVQEKVYFYYESPLEIITEGFIFIQELKKYSQESTLKINQKISQIQISKDLFDNKWIQKCFVIKKNIINSNNEALKSTSSAIEEENPFIDCTSSQIIIGQNQLLNNTSLEADISTISRQIKGGESRMSITPKKSMKSIKSIQKQRPRNSAKVFKLTTTPKANLTSNMKRPSSEIINYKFSPKLIKTQTTHQIIPENQIKPFDLKQPQKIYLQFSKNTLSDFFDISDCNLPSQKVVEYVQRARRIHRIKGLKLCNNRLTTAGFQKMCESLQGVSNINLANNNVTEGIFEVIIKNKQRLQSLRVLNLSHNPITLDKKSFARMQQTKKFGIILVL